MRLGEFLDRGGLWRVNGTTTLDDGRGRIEFYIDESTPYCDYDHTEGWEFTGWLSREEARMIAGVYERPDGEMGGFYATKDGTFHSEADSDWVSTGSIVGEWEIHSPALDGRIEITGTSSGGELSGRYYHSGENSIATSGTVDTSTNEVEMLLNDASDRFEFRGYAHEADRGIVGGYASTVGQDDAHPVVLARQGAARVAIRITSPDDGAAVEYDDVTLEAVVTRDGEEISDPGVVWTLNGPFDPGGPGGHVIANDARTSVSLPVGAHELYATFTGGDEQVPDTVTVAVNTGQSPNVTIDSPQDGGSRYEPDGTDGGQYYVDLDARGSATAADGTRLTGSDLQWSYWEEDDSSWRDAGTGESTTIRLRDENCWGTDYQIRLKATDSDGNTGIEVIEFYVDLEGC